MDAFKDRLHCVSLQRTLSPLAVTSEEPWRWSLVVGTPLVITQVRIMAARRDNVTFSLVGGLVFWKLLDFLSRFSFSDYYITWRNDALLSKGSSIDSFCSLRLVPCQTVLFTKPGGVEQIRVNGNNVSTGKKENRHICLYS